MTTEKYVVARVYNRAGASDYYAGKDEESGLPYFTGKGGALIYTNHNTAYGMCIRLKRILPTVMGGFPASYEVVEVEEKHEAA